MLFFCVSDTDSTHNFITALAFSQIFNLLCEKANNICGERLPHHARVLWGEVANTRQVPQLGKVVVAIRPREISLCLFYQAISQCKVLYKGNSETILENMNPVTFLRGQEHSTARETSEVLGKEATSMYTGNRIRSQSESYGQNLQRLGKELTAMDELTTIPGNRCTL